MSWRISSKLGRPSRWATFDFWLVKKLSRQMTSWPSLDQPLAEVRAEKAGPAGHQNSLERGHALYSRINSRTVMPDGIIGSTCSW